MVPLAIGDYVTIQGVGIDGTLWVGSLNADPGIFTAPGSQPACVTCELVSFDIVTNQEAEFAETRAVAWTTDIGGGFLN